mgnify:CR=1 FL=1
MNRIKELREDNDLLQRDICKVLSISQQQYSRYESELSQMTYEQLMILADYYHVSIDYLLYHTDVRKPYPKSIVYSEK